MSKVPKKHQSLIDLANKPTDAKKFDTNKAPISLIPTSAILEEAKVLAFGAEKYDKHNWRNGLEFSRVIDAALRHTLALTEGEDIDPESGLLHAAHARCCLAFLIEYYNTHPELDDRYKNEKESK